MCNNGYYSYFLMLHIISKRDKFCQRERGGFILPERFTREMAICPYRLAISKHQPNMTGFSYFVISLELVFEIDAN